MARIGKYVVWLWLAIPLGILITSQLGSRMNDVEWREKLVVSLPQSESALLGLIDALHVAGRDSEALEHAEKVVELYPESERGHKVLLALYGATGRAAAARGEIERLIELGKMGASDLVSAGVAVQRENTGLAIEYYTRALAMDPYHLEGNINLGVAHVELREWNPARMHLQRALALSPRNTAALANLGILERRAGRPRQAISHFEAVLRIDPNHTVARQLLKSTRLQLAGAAQSRNR